MSQKKMKNKHNKKRNTAFLYEVLITEMSKTSMSGDFEKRKKILSIIKEFFSKGKPLYKELSLYKTLQNTKCRDYNVASRFLNEIKNEYALVVNNEDIYGEQSKLINTINKESSSIFKNFVSNYKDLASINQIFNNTSKVKSRVIFEEKFIKNLCYIKENKNELKQIDSLTYGFFLKKFNEQYSSSLLESQKKTLTYYIMSFADNGITLKSFLNEEVGRLKNIILKSEDIKKDSLMREKSDKIIDFLNTFKEKNINEEMMKRVLELQSLANEILSEQGEKKE